MPLDVWTCPFGQRRKKYLAQGLLAAPRPRSVESLAGVMQTLAEDKVLTGTMADLSEGDGSSNVDAL